MLPFLLFIFLAGASAYRPEVHIRGDEYIIVKKKVPALTAMTACSWINVETEPDWEDRYFLSYATKESDNTILLGVHATWITTAKGTHVLRYGRWPVSFTLGSSTPDETNTIFFHPVNKYPVRNKDAHVCVTWSSEAGAHFYMNGKSAWTYPNFMLNHTIPGGDVSIVIGQEQDTMGGGFDPRQAWRGSVYELNVWGMVLTESEIQQIVYHANDLDFDGLTKLKCTVQTSPAGHVVSWLEILRGEVHGTDVIRDMQC